MGSSIPARTVQPWNLSVAVHGLFTVGSEAKHRELAGRYPGGLWCVARDKTTAPSERVWLNGGTTEALHSPGELPAWSRSHAALYEDHQAAAIALALEDDGWVVIVYRMF